VSALRKLRRQTLGRFGSTMTQRPSADFPGHTINSPPEPNGLFFTHVRPQFIGFHPAHFGGSNRLERLPLNRFMHPVHDRVVAYPKQPFDRSLPHAFKVMIQRRFPQRDAYPATIPFSTGLATATAQPTLLAVSAFPFLTSFSRPQPMHFIELALTIEYPFVASSPFYANT
jgi:hypothetical protein